MADFNAEEALKQEIQVMRWVVSRLHDPLSSFDPASVGFDLETFETMPAFVEFDPFAQFSPLPSTEVSSEEQIRPPQKPSESVLPELRSLAASPHLSTETQLSHPKQPAPDSVPVFSLQPPASDEYLRRSHPIPHQELSHAPPKQRFISPSRPENTPLAPMSLTEERGESNRPLLSFQPFPTLTQSRLLTDLQTGESPISPALATENSAVENQVHTLLLIGQIVDQMTTSLSTLGARNDSRINLGSNSLLSSLPLFTQQSMESFVSTSLSPPSVSSFEDDSHPATSIYSSQSFLTAAENHSLDLSLLQPGRPFSPGSSNLEISTPALSSSNSEPYPFTAEAALSEMAETLTLLVNDVLVEQARRHGVDLS